MYCAWTGGERVLLPSFNNFARTVPVVFKNLISNCIRTRSCPSFLPSPHLCTVNSDASQDHCMLRDGGLEPDCSSRMHEPNHIANPHKRHSYHCLLLESSLTRACLYFYFCCYAQDDFKKNLRRTVMRYVNLSTILVYRLVSKNVSSCKTPPCLYICTQC